MRSPSLAVWFPAVALMGVLGAGVGQAREGVLDPIDVHGPPPSSTQADPRPEEPGAPVPGRAEVTYAADIAPLLFEHCTECHSPGGSAPFSLRTYEEARDRAERIVRATTNRIMPPWLPAGGDYAFVGERLLDHYEIELLKQWAEAGAPPGDLTSAPTAPPIGTGWKLGEPDLIVRVPTYALPAEGRDVYRNMVLELPIEQRRYVTSVELRPGEGTAVHHARMMIDTTDSSWALDLEDAEPGFDGMVLRSNATNPDGHFLGWTPGKGALPPLEGMAWALDPGTHFVVQLHMRTTGEEEQVEAEVGFYFREEPPTREPALIVLSSLMIDIPPGDSAYRVTNSYELPVGVDLLSIYPHAHYLGKDLRGYAKLPNGSVKELIRVPEWDFNWQEEYRYQQPVRLPAGTVLSLDFVFDNSSENPHNPASPPKRVVYGSASTDEMADLILQVLPRDPSERTRLVEHVAWHYEIQDMAYMADQEMRMGTQALAEGDPDQAILHFREVMQYMVDHPGALSGLARSLLLQQEYSAAVIVAERAVQVTRRGRAAQLAVLAEAYAAAGDARALAVAEEALDLIALPGQAALGDSIRARLPAYREINR